MSSPRTPPVALTIAGSDSSGGAGIQADLKTFAALEVHGACAITALTAQSTTGVHALHDVPPEFVRAQIDAVHGDLDVRATKIGMLSRAATVAAVVAALRGQRAASVVLDPVMVSKSGARLLDDAAIAHMKDELLGLVGVLTPNLPEAAALLGVGEGEIARNPTRACEQLVRLGPRCVVLKGGHAGGQNSEDIFFDGQRFERLPARRILTENTHGTGCTFSAALAAALAHGLDPLEAAREAKAFVTAAIEAGSRWRLGHGHGPVHHFHALWKR